MLIQLIIIQVITFAAVVFVLRKLLYAETAKEAKRLILLRAENTRRQNELQEKIAAAGTVYNERISKAEGHICRLKVKAQEEAGQLRKNILSQAKQEAEQIVRAAFNKKDKLREEAAIEMQKKIPGLASGIFKEVLSLKVKKIIHEEIVEKAIDYIMALETNKFDSKVKIAEVVSAYPLSKFQKTGLISLLSQKLGHEPVLEEKEDKGLTAGFILHLGVLVVDASLQNRLRQIELES